jgi:hypothetical protein
MWEAIHPGKRFLQASRVAEGRKQLFSGTASVINSAQLYGESGDPGLCTTLDKDFRRWETAGNQWIRRHAREGHGGPF